MVSKAFSVKVQKANIVGFKGKRFLSQLLILATAALKLQETRCKVVVVYQWLIYLFVFPYRRPDFPHRIANPWSFNWKEWTILKLRIVFYLVDKTGYLSLGCILSDFFLYISDMHMYVRILIYGIISILFLLFSLNKNTSHF